MSGCASSWRFARSCTPSHGGAAGGGLSSSRCDRVSPLVGATFALRLSDRRRHAISCGSRPSTIGPRSYAKFLGQMRVRLGLGPSGEAASERRTIEVLDVFAGSVARRLARGGEGAGLPFVRRAAAADAARRARDGDVLLRVAATRSGATRVTWCEWWRIRWRRRPRRRGSSRISSARTRRSRRPTRSSSSSTPTRSRRGASKTSSCRTSRTSCARRSRPSWATSRCSRRASPARSPKSRSTRSSR